MMFFLDLPGVTDSLLLARIPPGALHESSGPISSFYAMNKTIAMLFLQNDLLE